MGTVMQSHQSHHWIKLTAPKQRFFAVRKLSEKELVFVARGNDGIPMHHFYKFNSANNMWEHLAINVETRIKAIFVDEQDQKLYVFGSLTGFIYDLSGELPILTGTTNLFNFQDEEVVQMVSAGDFLHIVAKTHLRISHSIWVNFRDEPKSSVIQVAEQVDPLISWSKLQVCLFRGENSVTRMFVMDGRVREYNPARGKWFTTMSFPIGSDRQLEPSGTIWTDSGYIISFCSDRNILIFDTAGPTRTVGVSTIKVPKSIGHWRPAATYQRYYSDEQKLITGFLGGVIRRCPECLVGLIGMFGIFVEWVHISVQFVRFEKHWRINLAEVLILKSEN